jgi:hypothetical protein
VFYFLKIIFWWDWSLNLRLHTCKAGAVPQVMLPAYFALDILEMGFCELFAMAGL